MGMFDELICRYPLPGTTPDFVKDGHTFQTKDMDCDLDLYEITQAGELVKDGSVIPYTGEIEFYSSNCRGGSHGISFTEDGEDSVYVGYKATFTAGKLVGLEQQWIESKPALPSSDFPLFRDTTGRPDDEEPDSFLGKTLFLLWGGSKSEDGYEAKCVAETATQLCLQSDVRGLEVESKSFFGNIIFSSREKALAVREWENRTDEETKNRLSEKLKSKMN